MLKTFEQWQNEQVELSEKQKRTCLGIYPPLYGVGQYPPLAHTPHSASAALALTTTHKDTVKKIMSKGKKKKRKKRRKDN